MRCHVLFRRNAMHMHTHSHSRRGVLGVANVVHCHQWCSALYWFHFHVSSFSFDGSYCHRHHLKPLAFFCAIWIWIKSCVFDVSCSFLSHSIRFTFTRKTKVKELKSLNCTENDEGRQSLNECERKRAGDETFWYAWFGYYEIAGDVEHEFCLRLCMYESYRKIVRVYRILPAQCYVCM